MKHVALYCRESVDRSGKAENVADQEAWGREYAGSKWPGVPVVVYGDNDTSAVGKPRPGYDRLKAALGRREVAYLWAVEQSRCERDEAPWFAFAAQLVAAGVDELHTRRDGVVPVRGLIAGIKAVVSAEERRRLIERVNDKLDRIAEAGCPPGSRPFGYTHALSAAGVRTYEVVPEQAKAIEFAAEKVLAGWSLSNIARELRERGLHGAHRVKIRNDRGEVLLEDGRYVDPEHVKNGRYGDPEHIKDGVAVTRPTELSAESVRRMLTSPAVAGHRVHRGTDHGPGSGNWPAILDEDTWQAVRDRLGAARTVTRSDGGAYAVGPAHTGFAGRRYVLTGGLAVCGVCQSAMLGQVLQSAKGKSYLICSRKKTAERKGACTGIMLAETEEFVVDRLFAELDKPEFMRRVAADDHGDHRRELAGRLEGIARQRRELAAMWARPGELTTEEWREARAGLDAQEHETRAALAAVPPPMAKIDIGEARQAWPHMTLDEQREFLRLFVSRVVIKRAVPGRRGFDDGRVDVEFIER